MICWIHLFAHVRSIVGLFSFDTETNLERLRFLADSCPSLVFGLILADDHDEHSEKHQLLERIFGRCSVVFLGVMVSHGYVHSLLPQFIRRCTASVRRLSLSWNDHEAIHLILDSIGKERCAETVTYLTFYSFSQPVVDPLSTITFKNCERVHFERYKHYMIASDSFERLLSRCPALVCLQISFASLAVDPAHPSSCGISDSTLTALASNLKQLLLFDFDSRCMDLLLKLSACSSSIRIFLEILSVSEDWGPSEEEIAQLAHCSLVSFRLTASAEVLEALGIHEETLF